MKALGLGRRLLASVLAALAATGHAEVRTLSPALGLPALLERWSRREERAARVVDAVLHGARADASPALAVMRLHLGGGARLERVLLESRADDHASARVNLRFRYATDPAARAEQRRRWQRWLAGRQAAMTHIDVVDGTRIMRAAAVGDALIYDGISG